VTIPAGQPTAAITLTPIDDADFEGDETVNLTLTANAAYSIGTPGAASVTVADNDVPTVTVDATDAAASEATSDPGTFTVTRTGVTTTLLDVLYAIGGTATNDSDFTPTLTGTVTIAAGQATGTITITPVNDPDIEGDETVSLTLSANAAYRVGTLGAVSVTIADNVVPPISQCGALFSGAIGAAAEVDTFTFSGQAGQIVTLALASTGGFSANPGTTGGATLTLVGPSGTAVGTLRSNSVNNFALRDAGTYVLRVNATNLATTGSYNVSLNCLLPVPTPAPILQCGALQAGTLTAPGEVDLYAFSGLAGQIVTLALASTGGFSANPGTTGGATLTLFGPSGTEVRAPLRSTSQRNYTLPAIATYVIRVNATNLTTTGSYSVRLICPA
jgi:hypothetical protein